MTVSELITAENVTLTNCDREEIHSPGSIQPHGLLFVLTEPQLEIVQVSQNTAKRLGVSAQALLGKSLSDLLGAAQVELVKHCLNQDFEGVNPIKLSINQAGYRFLFNGILHRSQANIILELEPIESTTEPNFLSFYQMIKAPIAKLQKAASLSELCDTIVQDVRKLTGFDRVMIYQFDANQAGTVIAEDKLDTLDSFLGLHYPASDIPKQARRLYTLNPLRIIPDIHYQPVEIVGQKGKSTLDLSFSVLRSVSPIHLDYLKIMGVRASMSISLLKDKQLWGLIACHHCSPKYLSYEVRTACEFLGQVMSLELASKEHQENLDYKIKLRAIQSQFIESITQTEDWVNTLLEKPAELCQLVGASGAAIYANGELNLIGKTPSASDVHDLIPWLENQWVDNLFYTDCLCQHSPKMEPLKAIASGLLAVSITQVRKNYILWFRPEVVQVVNWAGNPNKPTKIEADGSLTISPRQSFAKWQESVQGKSLPWQNCEVEGALELRSAIVGIVLRKADVLAEVNVELERSNSELDSFAYIASHDLKEPLRGIHNYSNFFLQDYADILNSEGVEKLKTLVRLTQRMEDLINGLLHFSRLGRQELKVQPVDLNKLLQNVTEILYVSQKDVQFELRIPQPLPHIHCDPLLIEEVFVNLISNALKYNNNSLKWVEIGSWESNHDLNTEEAETNWGFYVRDNGIGIRQKHLDSIFRIFKRLHSPNKYGGGTGAGLTIVKKIIERHNGRIWLESTYGEGTTFYFTLQPTGVEQEIVA